MKTDFQVGKMLNIKEHAYKIVGADLYRLENLRLSSQHWISYTLLGENRCWITNGIEKRWHIWSSVDRIKIKKKFTGSLRLLLNFSGLAMIDFRGERGISQPIAEVLIFKDKNNQLIAVERFPHRRKTYTYYYVGHGLKKGEIRLH